MCQTVTFAEQMDGADRPVSAAQPAGWYYWRGWARAGGPGPLAAAMGAAAHRTTLLRLVTALPERRTADPRS